MNILIYGKGDFAKIIYQYLKRDKKYKVLGFCVDKEYIDKDIYLGLPLFDVDNIASKFDMHNTYVYVAVGYSSMEARQKMFDKAVSFSFKFTNIICEGVNIDSSVNIGSNNIFMPGVIIEPFTKIGNNNIFWSSSLVCHDVTIGNHNFFAAKTIIGGFSKVRDRNFLGFSVVVIDNINISSNILLGASSLVIENIGVAGTYHGTPAKYKH